MRRRRHTHCAYCKREMKKGDAKDNLGRHHPLAFSRDHVEPKQLGGARVVACCRACNTVKANLTRAQWEAFMALNPQWWTLYPHTALTHGVKPW